MLGDDTLAELEQKIDAFAKEFQPGKDQGVVGAEKVDAAEAEDVNQERIVKGRR